MMWLIVFTGKSKSSTTIIAIAVPISVAFVLFAIGVCFLRRTSKKYDKFLEPDGKKWLSDHHIYVIILKHLSVKFLSFREFNIFNVLMCSWN